MALGLLTQPIALKAQSFSPSANPPQIRHLVVIFQENVSFDHYFGTYPNATNPEGEPAFHAVPGTPGVNGLTGGCSRKIRMRSTAPMARARSIRFVWIEVRQRPPIRITTMDPNKPRFTAA